MMMMMMKFALRGPFVATTLKRRKAATDFPVLGMQNQNYYH